MKQKYVEDHEGLQGARSLRRVKLGKHKGKENNTHHSAKSCFQVGKKNTLSRSFRMRRRVNDKEFESKETMALPLKLCEAS